MKILADKHINAVLCFADGKTFFGKGVGSFGSTFGEICFQTSQTGYQEILTDPSYAGQIITFTFPHVGNVGCNIDDHESKEPVCKGLIIREEITNPSNFRSEDHLNKWLLKYEIVGISSVDTREITKYIRLNGAQNVIIHHAKQGETINTELLIKTIKSLKNLDGTELAAEFSTKKPYTFLEKSFQLNQASYDTITNAKYKVVAVDYGIKKNILRCLCDQNFEVIVVPAKSSFDEIMSHKPHGVFLSNGPGDPFATAEYAVPVIQKLLNFGIPTAGICMGHQLLALACGLKTIKMHQGHRGANHPVKNLETGRVEITSQNHGFCVDKGSNEVVVTHVSLFDGTIQGLRLKNKPAFSIQSHPEASPGPHESRYFFKNFYELIAKHYA
jgi:carbamoyl-phosphate synthase small subunit